jgi:histidinol dehydrogenase
VESQPQFTSSQNSPSKGSPLLDSEKGTLRPFAHTKPLMASLKSLSWATLDPLLQESLLARPGGNDGINSSWQVAQTIVTQVRKDKDRALWELGARFDGWNGPWTRGSLAVSTQEWEMALESVTKSQQAALERASTQIEAFHRIQKPQDTQAETSPGIFCSRRFRPIGRVGIYVPGGHAPLPSSLLMSAVPARLAGCKQIIVCTPASPTGHVHPAILAAARLAGVTQVFRSGGAQAIAAMAYGTREIPKVDKIFGPGNSYVTAAKSICAMDPQGAAIDMPAGPSEVMVVADRSARPEWIAADLLSQAEHGADSHVVLVLKDLSLYEPTLRALENQLDALQDYHSPGPRGQSTQSPKGQPREMGPFTRAQQSLHLGSVIYAPTDAECLDIINRYAPEHLILQMENARALSDHVENAGSIFIGHLTPESLGDYASGTNHVLPTFGAARSYSGLGLEAFFKSVTIQEASEEGLRELAPTVVELASLEGLKAHGAAVSIRLSQLSQKSMGADDGEPLISPEKKSPTTLMSPIGQSSFSDEFEQFVKPLLRSSLLTMRGYESARSLVDKKTEQELPKIFLDANENHHDPWGESHGLNRYPDPQPLKLVNRLADYYQVGSENILLTAGADQGIDLLIRLFCDADKDAIVITPPTYGYYEVSAQIQGARTLKVPLLGENFELDIPGICQAVNLRGAKVVFVCSPNNPTGIGVNYETLLELAEVLRGKALLIVDEAYGEFFKGKTVTSLLMSHLAANPHLVVLRTLSKSFGLAGLRLGSVLGSMDLIRFMQKVRPPYPLSQASVERADGALQLLGSQQNQVDAIILERERLRRELLSLPLVRRVFPSETNFLLVLFNQPIRVMEACHKAGIVVRDRSRDERLDGCVRITVGSPDENNALLKVLRTLKETPNAL